MFSFDAIMVIVICGSKNRSQITCFVTHSAMNVIKKEGRKNEKNQ